MNQILKYKALKLMKKTTIIRKGAENTLYMSYKGHLTVLCSNFPFFFYLI